MMLVVKHIIWQKRILNCLFPAKGPAGAFNVKKSELIVNFGEAENGGFHQF